MDHAAMINWSYQYARLRTTRDAFFLHVLALTLVRFGRLPRCWRPPVQIRCPRAVPTAGQSAARQGLLVVGDSKPHPPLSSIVRRARDGRGSSGSYHVIMHQDVARSPPHLPQQGASKTILDCSHTTTSIGPNSVRRPLRVPAHAQLAHKFVVAGVCGRRRRGRRRRRGS